jgi:hypothetical protein
VLPIPCLDFSVFQRQTVFQRLGTAIHRNVAQQVGYGNGDVCRTTAILRKLYYLVNLNAGEILKLYAYYAS